MLFAEIALFAATGNSTLQNWSPIANVIGTAITFVADGAFALGSILAIIAIFA